MRDIVKIEFKVLHENATIPTKGTAFSGGWDVTCTEIVLDRHNPSFVICKLGFAVAIPDGYKLTLVPRSSITKTSWIMQNTPGLIDSDYRGECQMRFRSIPVGIEPNPDNDYPMLYQPVFPFKEGECIGQIYLEDVIPMIFEEVDTLSETVRGAGGFGSTNK